MLQIVLEICFEASVVISTSSVGPHIIKFKYSSKKYLISICQVLIPVPGLEPGP